MTHPNCRDALRAELESTRNQFHQLLDSISDADWQRPVAKSHWNLKAEIFHVVQAAQFIPGGIEQAQRGQRTSLLSMVPTGLRDWVNGYILIPLLVRNATRESIMRHYDLIHAETIAKLDTLLDSDLDKRTIFLGRDRTIADILHRPTEHFLEHAAHIRENIKNYGKN